MTLLYEIPGRRQHKKGKHNQIKKGKMVSDALDKLLSDIAVQDLGC
jgi:hypothetical protein